MSRLLTCSLLVILVLLTSACKTLEQNIKHTQHAVNVARSGSVQTLVNIANSDSKTAAVKGVLRARGDAYKTNPTLLISDVNNIKRDFRQLLNLLQGKVDESWGKKERRLPSRSRYIKYTHNYKSRAIVDFDNGRITVETLEDKTPETSLKNAIITTLLTPDDPRAVDLFSANDVVLNSDKPPYLLDLVEDQKGRRIDSPKRAEAFADFLLKQKKQSRQLSVNNVQKQALQVEFNMVNNFETRQAEKYRPMVERYARRYNISTSLIYAVIRTESNFNPFAVSRIPAYGLMQLVPASGGRDAYRHAKGQDGVPSKDYLFQPENNIELGVAYLDVLDGNYLKHIQNKVSREYCVISAYNGGAGNVLRTFANDKTEAVNIINSLKPGELYQRLRTNLPSAETRRYLHKVVNHRRQYVSL